MLNNSAIAAGRGCAGRGRAAGRRDAARACRRRHRPGLHRGVDARLHPRLPGADRRRPASGLRSTSGQQGRRRSRCRATMTPPIRTWRTTRARSRSTFERPTPQTPDAAGAAADHLGGGQDADRQREGQHAPRHRSGGHSPRPGRQRPPLRRARATTASSAGSGTTGWTAARAAICWTAVAGNDRIGRPGQGGGHDQVRRRTRRRHRRPRRQGRQGLRDDRSGECEKLRPDGSLPSGR